ncbi:MAG: hypothetical protein M1501_03055 [Candidatus Omnitrophica bacterium]|nr:hypothetical protein [Candidatus Omnitrophota bacterium]
MWSGDGGEVSWAGANIHAWQYRHNGGADLLFCDGHVKWYIQSVLKNSQYFPSNGNWYGNNGWNYDWPFAINPAVSY